VLLTVVSVFGAAGDVDQTFIATTGRDTPTTFTALQPDGKVLVFGSFDNINGVARHKIWRLNIDGTIDNSFNCACENFTNVISAVAQTDGKIVIGGFGTAQGFAVLRFARLNADGSVDASFTPYNIQSTVGVSYGGLMVWAIQPDGKPLISYFTSGIFQYYLTLSRLNADGSLDNTFTSLTFNYRFQSQQALNQLQILPDGKIMIGGRHTFGDIFRINSDGTKDTSFVAPALTNNGGEVTRPSIYTFGFQSTGKILIGGNFLTVNAISRTGFARLNADGSLDLGFTSSTSTVQKLVIVSGDKILLGTARLNSDGSVDNAYSPAFTFVSWQMDVLERIVFIGDFTEDGVTGQRIGRMNADGSADNSFNIAIIESRGEVVSTALQPDGKILLSGLFDRVNGMVRHRITRVNADGSLDQTFNSGSGISGAINVIFVQPDGKILIGGDFSNYNGSQQDLARINADGSLDATFNPVLTSSSGSNHVAAIAFQTDGKILISGFFSTVNGVNRTNLARLNADGSLDNSFNPILGGSAASLLVQADGKIMIGGTFAGVNGVNRQNFARLNADASLDSSFDAGSIPAVSQISQTAGGKYLVRAGVTVLRRNNDGSADGSFPTITLSAATGGNSLSLKRFLLQADGSIILVGEFVSVNQIPRRNIARIKPNGVVDPLFFPTGTDFLINTIIGQTDGKLIIGGAFSTIENVPRSGIARLISPAVPNDTNFDFDGDGKSDVSVFRPSENKWYVLKSSDLTVQQQVFAIAGDVPVPADYDGDGKTDFAIFRPSSGDWWSLSSLNGAQIYAHWGQSGAIPRPSDFDGDGLADYIYFLPSNSTWYRYGSNVGFVSPVTFGLAGDKPVIGDFDGDRKTDVAIYRPSTGDWWWKSSLNGAQLATHWGISTDIPAPADFDDDGKTDFAVYRPETGVWYIYNSGSLTSTIMNFGIAEDKPVPADYDGDGKADIAVFRPSTGVWYLQQSTAGFWALNWGISTDIPTENAFVP
jgi:uncharacterized delta-60 repeat protein